MCELYIYYGLKTIKINFDKKRLYYFYLKGSDLN